MTLCQQAGALSLACRSTVPAMLTAHSLARHLSDNRKSCKFVHLSSSSFSSSPLSCLCVWLIYFPYKDGSWNKLFDGTVYYFRPNTPSFKVFQGCFIDLKIPQLSARICPINSECWLDAYQ